MRWKSLAALTAAVAIWGSTFIVLRLLVLQSTAPITITLLRFLMAYLALLPLARRRGYTLRMTLQPRSLLFGLTGVALPFGLDNVALLFTSAGSASLIYGAFPAVMTLFSALFLKESMHARKIAGILLAVLGVGIISAEGWGVLNGKTLLGDALVMGSVFAWAAFNILSRKASQQMHPLALTQASFGGALVVLLPLSLAEVAWLGAPQFTWGGALALLYLGLAASALAFYLWNYALAHVEASVAGAFGNLQPVFGLLFAVLGGERLLPVQALGGALALLGVWLCESRQNKVQSPVEAASAVQEKG